MPKTYQHFCPVARSLEVIGEKWSLLVVRDLLLGPQRFTDLQRYLGGITPKWLSQRLRDLEAAGIVERDSEPGRREVWYRLTEKGGALGPVVAALAVWGIDYALRPPLPDEPVHPEQSMMAITTYLNERGRRLLRPATWVLRFAGRGAHTVRFDGERWSTQPGESEADVLIETTPEEWVTFLTSNGRRRQAVRRLRIQGEPDRVEEFLQMFGATAKAAAR